jgi:hypothetical protein
MTPGIAELHDVPTAELPDGLHAFAQRRDEAVVAIFGYSSGDRRLSSTSIVADMIPPMPRRAKFFSKFLQAGVTVPS